MTKPTSTPRTDAAKEAHDMWRREWGSGYEGKEPPQGWEHSRTLETELSRTREALREAVDAWERWADDVGSERARIAAIRREFNLE